MLVPRFIFRVFHRPKYKKQYLSLLYLASALRNFVFYFVALFMPTYLWQIFLAQGISEKTALF